ncbi:Uncharacterised protein [Mycobacteroides abscessus subsp. abscessus]|nr:Uncharacterised protein [Mycobacteroides abscessus subsp. abscessus]
MAGLVTRLSATNDSAQSRVASTHSVSSRNRCQAGNSSQCARSAAPSPSEGCDWASSAVR